MSATAIFIGIALSSGGTALGEATPPTTSPPSSSVLRPASMQTVAAATSALPPGTTIQVSQSIVSPTADYDHVVGLAADGSIYDITVYREFSASDLNGAGLTKASMASGTIWIGSDGPDQRSVYFLGSAGPGVRLASSSSSGHTASLP